MIHSILVVYVQYRINIRILYKLKHYQNKIPFITLYKIPIYRLCLVNTMEFDIDAHVTVI